jgi:hypothetical protein
MGGELGGGGVDPDKAALVDGDVEQPVETGQEFLL